MKFGFVTETWQMVMSKTGEGEPDTDKSGGTLPEKPRLYQVC
jgi:hypothetical protein